jgi:hypothetical protein
MRHCVSAEKAPPFRMTTGKRRLREPNCDFVSGSFRAI